METELPNIETHYTYGFADKGEPVKAKPSLVIYMVNGRCYQGRVIAASSNGKETKIVIREEKEIA